jgi:hypothetical protein
VTLVDSEPGRFLQYLLEPKGRSMLCTAQAVRHGKSASRWPAIMHSFCTALPVEFACNLGR